MDERVLKFRVGVIVIAAMLLAGIMVVLFGDPGSLVRGGYTVHIHFDEAPGVSEGTPVRKSGILIGRVSKVRFADQGGVNVDIHIHPEVKLYRDEIPQVSGSLLGGDVVIQFIKRPPAPAKPAAPPAGKSAQTDSALGVANQLTADTEVEPAPKQAPKAAGPREGPQDLVHDGDYIEGTVAPNAFQAIGNLEGELGDAINNLSTAGSEVAKLATSLNSLLENNDEQINRIVNKTETMIDTFQQSLNNLDDVLGDAEVRQNLKKSITELPQLFTDTRETVNTMQATLESVDRNMRNLEGFTGPLGDRGDQIVTNIDQALARLDGLLVEMSDFGRKLNSGEGTLGQLMRSPDLYQHLNAAAINIERITCELKPILGDARVFSDKIARHPELLGVRGAIQTSPGTK
jgi:phospholipid/cholesterol/gamma-HCH transport system substrate-binding protein